MPPKTFLLVHGAWHGAWCWRKLTPLLEQAGATVLAPDLPGCGLDRTPAAACTLDAYVERVLDLVDRVLDPIVLVGHALGGMTISQIAEERPHAIRCLVYLTALLPRNGEAAEELIADRIPEGIVRSEQYLRLLPDEAPPVFYQDCAAEDVRFAQKHLRPQVLGPLKAPVRLSERFESVPRAYLTCTADRALSPQDQQRMYTATPCHPVLALSSGHAPFFSMPERLAEYLLTLESAPSSDLSDPSLGLA